jgi:hypothetical protein
MKPSINQVLADPELLNHDNCWSFYDWFCKNSSLEREAKAMLSKLRFLVNEGVIDGDKNYVWFKNNCPMCGTNYTDMRFCSLEEKDEYGDDLFIGGACPKTGHYYQDFKCNIWSIRPDLVDHEFTNLMEFKKSLKTHGFIYKTLKEHYAV